MPTETAIRESIADAGATILIVLLSLENTFLKKANLERLLGISEGNSNSLNGSTSLVMWISYSPEVTITVND